MDRVKWKKGIFFLAKYSSWIKYFRVERLQAIIRHDLDFERGVFKSRRKLERKREKQSSVYENIVKEILQWFNREAHRKREWFRLKKIKEKKEKNVDTWSWLFSAFLMIIRVRQVQWYTRWFITQGTVSRLKQVLNSSSRWDCLLR